MDSVEDGSNSESEDAPGAVRRSSTASTTTSGLAEHLPWYPGKLIKKAIHHRQETKRAKTLREAEAAETRKLGEIAGTEPQQEKQQGEKQVVRARDAPERPGIGRVVVRGLAARNLRGWARRDCYCYVALEDKRVQTVLIHKYVVQEDGEKVWRWPEEFKFDVSDIGSDLRVCLYSSVPLTGKDLCVGTCIVPLMSILPVLQTKARLKAWLEIFPLPPNELFFTPIVNGMPDAAGLDRPSVSLGQIYVDIELRLRESDLLALLLSSPFRNIHPKIPDEPDPQYIKGGMNRIKIALTAPYAVSIIADLVAWKSSFASTLTILIWAHLTLLCPFWLYPFMAAIIITSFGLASRGTQNRSHVRAFKDETVADPDLPNTVPKKLRMIKKLLVGLQKLVNKIASLLERSGNALNWTDDRVSLVVSFVVIAAGFVLSVILLSWSILTYFIPARRVFFALGLVVMTPPRLLETPIPGFLARCARPKSLSQIAKERDALDDGLDDDESTDGSKYGDALDGKEGSTKKKETDYSEIPIVPNAEAPTMNGNVSNLRTMLINLSSRIPDEREIAHRIIARTQIVQEVP